MAEGFAPTRHTIEASVTGAIDAWATTMVELRRHLHAHPELSFGERETTRHLATLMASWNVPHRVLPRGVGLIAELKRAPQAPWVAIRADIDALAIEERSTTPYRSQVPGVMHACGHDGHAAMVAGALRGLLAAGFDLPGNVRVLFQPAEEVAPGGAIEMVEAGALDGVRAIFGLHVAPELQVGTIGLREGAMTASSDRFDIKVLGRGGHGARPHQAVDPIFIGSQIVPALYLGMRRFDPRDTAVLTVGMFRGGDSPNIIPDTAELSGTIRTTDPASRPRIFEMVRQVARDVADLHDGHCAVTLSAGPPPIVNDAACNEALAAAAAATVGAANLQWIPKPSMGAEDFAEYLRHVPGAMFRLGVGSERCSHGLHSADFDLEESALPIGAKILALAVARTIQNAAEQTASS